MPPNYAVTCPNLLNPQTGPAENGQILEFSLIPISSRMLHIRRARGVALGNRRSLVFRREAGARNAAMAELRPVCQAKIVDSSLTRSNGVRLKAPPSYLV